MKIFFSLIFLTSSAFACDISMPYRLITLGDEVTTQSPINSSGCSSEVIKDFHQTLAGLEGRISSSHLTEMLASRGHDVRIQPHTVQIQSIKSYIRDQLNLPQGVHVKSTYANNSSSFLAIAPGDQIHVNCQACLWGAKQPLNISIAGFDGERRDMIVFADFGKMTKAYRLIKPVNSFSEITSQDLKEEVSESIPHLELITDLNNLKYYKTNKPLRSGELLKLSDLNAVNIVKAGLRTEVVLENEQVRIKTSGISRNNGAIGDLVEVYHPQKNKKYQGKVIDNNKVLVEL